MKGLNWAEKWLPIVWGWMWIFLITALTVGAIVWVCKWILSLMGVM